MKIWMLATLAASLVGCGGPVLQNAPKVNPTVVAASAAAIAGAATLADPAGAARRQEQKRESDVVRSSPEGSTRMPSDVLDRLDEAEQKRKAAGDED